MKKSPRFRNSLVPLSGPAAYHLVVSFLDWDSVDSPVLQIFSERNPGPRREVRSGRFVHFSPFPPRTSQGSNLVPPISWVRVSPPFFLTPRPHKCVPDSSTVARPERPLSKGSLENDLSF